MKKVNAVLVAALVGLAACQQNATTQRSTAARVDSLLALMTLEEKIGQLTLYTSDYDVTGPSIRPGYKQDLKEGKVGAIFNAIGASYTRSLQDIAVKETRLGIPLLFGYDVVHGYKTIFPINLGETASWDLDAMELSARIAADEASSEGIHWTYAPMVDIARDPRWGRISEGAGEDTYLGQEAARVRVRGFQGEDLSAINTVAACVKHYAAYGAAQAGRDYHTVDMSERTLREVYLPPFRAAVDAGVATVMTSFNENAGVPATVDRFLLTEVLRNDWGFGGFVVTDYTSIMELMHHGVAADTATAAELSINAGVDMDMQAGFFQDKLAALVKAGRVKEARIDEAVRKILTLKFELGLFDDPYRYCDTVREKETIMKPEYLESARDVARKSIVLLKNDKSVLPLSKDIKRLAVIGPLANNKKELIGSWSAQGDWKKSVSLLEGIRAQVSPSTQVLFAKGSNINDDTTQYFAEALRAAKQADVVVLAIGEAAWMSGEASSRSDIRLPGVQQRLADEIIKTGKPVVVVLMNGRPLAIPELDEKASAILETWFLGTQAGHAIADVLFGNYNPSGKLPVTFPRSVGQVPIFYNMKHTGRPMEVDPKNKYTSKYLDIPNSPLYPFGYGLSYTQFSYSDVTLSGTSLNTGDSLIASVTVTNTGKVAGEEVVQLYVQDLFGSVTRPVKELKGFQKISLKPGESRTVTFTIKPADLAFYRLDMTFGTEPGDFKVYIGGNSRDVQEASFVLN
jgi:beta-glucosidase